MEKAPVIIEWTESYCASYYKRLMLQSLMEKAHATEILGCCSFVWNKHQWKYNGLHNCAAYYKDWCCSLVWVSRLWDAKRLRCWEAVIFHGYSAGDDVMDWIIVRHTIKDWCYNLVNGRRRWDAILRCWDTYWEIVPVIIQWTESLRPTTNVEYWYC